MGSFFRVNTTSVMRGAARLLYAGLDVAKPTKIDDVIRLSAGSTQFDPRTGWIDVGATREGIHLLGGNPETKFEINQELGIPVPVPGAQVWTLSTKLVETSLERIQFAWSGSTLQTNGAGEQVMGKGPSYESSLYRMAVIFKRASGKFFAVFVHQAALLPVESALNFLKRSDPMTLPVQFLCIADPTESNYRHRYFRIHDQL